MGLYRVHPLRWVPKITGTFLGVPIIRTIVYWGLYWGTPILGNYHLYDLVRESKLKGLNLRWNPEVGLPNRCQ